MFARWGAYAKTELLDLWVGISGRYAQMSALRHSASDIGTPGYVADCAYRRGFRTVADCPETPDRSLMRRISWAARPEFSLTALIR